MGLVILTNGYTTQSSLPISFMGYHVDYQDIDIYSCITTTSTIIPDDTSTMCLTSTEVVYTTVPTTTTTVATTSRATTSAAATSAATTSAATTSAAATTPAAATLAPTTSRATTSSAATTSPAAISSTPIIWAAATAKAAKSASTTATAITSTGLTTMQTTGSSMFVAPACANQNLGVLCNISSDPCTMAQPCLNLATCHLNTSIPIGYICSCVSGFSGVNCEVDKRVCRPGSTCLNGGICNETSNETNCICPAGKTGDHCEYEVDICANISCKNNAQCISIYGNWSCLCTNTELYSGIYCETKSSSLRAKEIFSRSLSGVAIGCIATVIGFVLIMDILKYFFNIDPVNNDLSSLKEKKANQRQQERKKWRKNKSRKPVIAVQFHYIHA